VHNEIWLPRLTAELRALGLEVIPSVGNFISVGFGEDGPRSAAKALAFLNRRGVLPRAIGAYGLGGHLRFTVGLEAENLAVIDGVKAFLGVRDA
jgi:histidinol-phosphate aminotransferase